MGPFARGHGFREWQVHWWGSALAANIAHYAIDPVTNIAVHGSGPLSIAQTLAMTEKQVAAAVELCRTTEQGGRFVFGCPVQYDARGPLPLAPRRSSRRRFQCLACGVTRGNRYFCVFPIERSVHSAFWAKRSLPQGHIGLGPAAGAGNEPEGTWPRRTRQHLRWK